MRQCLRLVKGMNWDLSNRQSLCKDHPKGNKENEDTEW